MPLPSTPLDRTSAADRAAGADRGIDRGALERSRLVVHPASARVVLEVLRRPDDSAGDLTKVILTDPALAAAVLRAANSAHLGYSRRIGGVRQATVMLGTGLVNSLAASRVADLVFDTEAPDYPEWLWLHSIATACAASVLARRVGEAPDEAYTAGLLHEVGWLLGAGAGVAHPEHDHAEIGGLLLSRWNLPDRITAAVRMHHARPAGLAASLDRVVVAAQSFAVALGATGPERTLQPMEALQLLQLREVRQSAVMQEIETELAAVTSDLVGGR